MSSPINKQTLEHLAELARIKLDAREEEKLLDDLKKILNHFEELKAIDTSQITPVTGGTELKNVFRGDAESENTDQKSGINAFPETQDGFLKVPPIFEQ